MASFDGDCRRLETKDLELNDQKTIDKTRIVSPASFVIEFSDAETKPVDLQDAFIEYRRQRQKEIKKCRKRKDINNEARLRALADPTRMWNLRMKFMEQLKKYFGVPYAKKYWKPEEPEFSSPVFLDCCGLIRRAMRDLKKDFGFKIGPWNQGYMYDTLPITIEKEEDMQPGDLVFIAATYYNPKMKKQKHDITHVEVWYGDGPKTIGSRWHRGHVQIFDSYAFEPKAYHSERYIFKSIDTWLMGICRSHCPDHQWKIRSENFKPCKKSIFSLEKKQKPDEIDEQNASESEDSPERKQPLHSQDINRPARTPRSIGLDLGDDDDEDDDSDEDSDDETTTTDTTSVTTTTSEATSTTTTTTNETSTSAETSSVGSSSLADTSSMAQSSDTVSEISTTVSESEARKNLNRDFAKLNPREGKESDSKERKRNLKCVLSYSNGASPQVNSPYCKLDTDLDGNPIDASKNHIKPSTSQNPVTNENQINLPKQSANFVFDETCKAWTVSDMVFDLGSKMWIPSNAVVEYGSDSDEENASLDSETLQEEDGDTNIIEDVEKLIPGDDVIISNTATSVECQTGVGCGYYPHILTGDKWTSPVNMLCYASVCKGDAAVQVKNPDLISESSSSASSSGDADDEGLPQEEASNFDGYVSEVSKSATEKFLEFQKSLSQISDESGTQRSISDESGFQSSEYAFASLSTRSRPSSASSIAARVGSALAFQAPSVGTLYSDNSEEASSQSDSPDSKIIPTNSGNHETIFVDGVTDTAPEDTDEKKGAKL